MKTAYPRVCLTTLAIAGLTACADGGGTTGGISATVQPNFTTWGASIGPGKTLVVAGDSQQGTYTFDVGTNRVTARTLEAQATGTVLTMTFTEIIPALSNFWTNDVRLQTRSGENIRFDRANGDSFFTAFYGPFWGIESANGEKLLIMADPDIGENGFDYQSYGIWVTGIGTASGNYGATSVGAPSPASAIPVAGLATYEGTVAGRHVDVNGFAFYTAANMVTSVDFFRRELTFTTSNTRQTDDVRAFTGINSMTTLNMAGTLNIVPGTNQFTGAVTTPGGLTGTATGRFYGPAIQEIGGTFSTTGAGVQSYSGAFGGVKN